jgi:hypothetical protein
MNSSGAGQAVNYFLRLKIRPRFRANGAEHTSPGHRPGSRGHLSSPALEGRRVPAPLQGAPQLWDSVTQGVALG